MPKLTRRQAIGVMAATPVPIALAAQAAADSGGAHPSVTWLGGSAPPVAYGVSFGVPWPKGAVKSGDHFSLTTASGLKLPVQSWHLASWPDGSVKWTGFATVAGPDATGGLHLAPTASPSEPAMPLRITEAADSIDIDTGRLQCHIGKHGAALIQSMTIEGREVAANGRLLCTLEDRSQLETNRTVRYQDFVSDIKKVTVEQSGPVRGVVKIEGVHKAVKGSREWLPFVVRLYFYAGQEAVRAVHTIVFDGDDQKDFICGLGMVFDVPLREQAHNRHARFTGEGDGVWAEAIQPVTGRRPLIVNGQNALPDQIAGKRIPNKEQLNQREQTLLDDWAIWSDFKLVQANADGFTVHKRTNPESCWLESNAGKRASGMAFIGDVTGGPLLAHVATSQGLVAAENACGRYLHKNETVVPNCIFTTPEIGTVGLGEQEAQQQGRKIKTGKYLFGTLGKAMAIGEPIGFVKWVADAETDQLLGAHAIGPHATDIIAEAAVAIRAELTATDLGRTIHAHPTLAEAWMEAAHVLLGEPIHSAPPRKSS